jgi:two-component sensor histidine kinase
LKTADPSVICVTGPHVFLAPEAVQNLGLALHELATNAIKHGALSGAAGTISVSWRIDQPSGQSPRFVLQWVEQGPSLSAEPPHRGFGRTVLDHVVPASLGGSASMEFGQHGIAWILDVPLASLERRAREPAAA